MQIGEENNVNDKISILIALGVASVFLSSVAAYYSYQSNKYAGYAYEMSDMAYFEASECVKQR